jgi:hypothetical protein
MHFEREFMGGNDGVRNPGIELDFGHARRR